MSEIKKAMKHKEKIIVTNSFEETQRLGEGFAKKNRIIALYGDLGSGKTTFAQGLARGFGIKRRIVSPTFVIIRSYNIKNTNKKLKMFYHIDLYRIENEKHIEGLGLEEIISNPENVVVIEWAEKMGKLLPKERWDIRFEHLKNDKRKISVIKNE